MVVVFDNKVSCVKVIARITAKDYLVVWINSFSPLLVDIREHLCAKRSIENQLQKNRLQLCTTRPCAGLQLAGLNGIAGPYDTVWTYTFVVF